MFDKILIANRGEIACRVIRTARRLGIRSVAVYSDADAGARHVRLADEAICIGGPRSADSYLRADRIIAAAEIADVDAIHPGYGFLSENAKFAEQCETCNIKFIGPKSKSIKMMGDKAIAKDTVRKAGVPIVPGSDGPIENENETLKHAKNIGYPVMIKAVAGGGGRGMRLVADAASFPDALRSARSEAQGAFGDPTVILERAIIEPRHIEIQVFGDRYGNAIHLGERDCSVQRRHQKLIEEAPSPAVSAELRAKMGEVAVVAVKALGYQGAGTLEFLLDQQGEFYFMEMNTRLQVEHPVTEAITGLDLVELQLRIAAGEPLPLKQQDVRFHGHAIEVRLCSEDAAHDFMPQSGTMVRWQMPGELRVEHALRSGAENPPYYDSMIAKIIAHGASRDEARRRLLHGLDTTIAFGVATNRAFLASCIRHPAFAAGDATTGFIPKHRAELFAAVPDDEVPASAVAALLWYLTDGHAARWRQGRSLAATFPVRLRLEIDGAPVDLAVHRERDGSYVVHNGERSVSFDLDGCSDGELRFRARGLSESAVFSRDGDWLYVQRLGVTTTIRDLTRAAPARASAGGGDGRVRAAMNGRVVAVLVKPGDRVSAGQPVLTLEAMKMEHVHAAPISGIILAIDVAEGEQVSTGRIVAEIEAEPSRSEAAAPAA